MIILGVAILRMKKLEKPGIYIHSFALLMYYGTDNSYLIIANILF